MRLVKASEKAVNDMATFCQRHQIDCELRLDGACYIATNKAQAGVMTPVLGQLNEHPNIFYGCGYSGNGVTQALLGGNILRSLVLGVDDEWSRCGFVGGPRGYFPPEPVRYVGAHMVRNAIRRKEKAEDADRKPAALDSYLATFAKTAGKADK